VLVEVHPFTGLVTVKV
jgi:hypothetical protein